MNPLGFTNLKDRPELKRLLDEAAKRKMTPAEIKAQRISWVAGEIGMQYPNISAEECRRRAERRAVEDG